VHKSFFLNLTLVVGPAHYWIRYTEENGPERNDIRISTFQSARLAVGYNGDLFFGGLSVASQNPQFALRAGKFFQIKISTFRLMLGYRFKETGILKSASWITRQGGRSSYALLLGSQKKLIRHIQKKCFLP